MIQIDRHIEILLLNNDCVIVPGLGGFMAHHVCARYCADTQTYLPPLRQLGFNAQLKINDSLLAQSYIEAYDISYPEAIRRIEDEVTELLQMLQNDGVCELHDIGILKINVEGNIEFEPCEAGILTPELYGLNTVDIVPLNVQATAPKPVVQEKEANSTPLDIFNEQPKPAPQLVVNKTNTPETADVIEEEEDDEPSRISIRISTLRHIGVAAAVILALFLCALPFGKMSQPELTKSYIDTGILYNILPKDQCSATTDTSVRTISFNEKKAETTEAEAPVVEKEPAKEAEKPAEVKPTEEKAASKHFFGIVLASRVARTNAEDFVKRLGRAGYKDAEVVVRPNGGLKVVYGHYTTESEAMQNLRTLRDADSQFADGWIMEFNN